jgi:hypothetical protein
MTMTEPGIRTRLLLACYTPIAVMNCVILLPRYYRTETAQIWHANRSIYYGEPTGHLEANHRKNDSLGSEISMDAFGIEYLRISKLN